MFAPLNFESTARIPQRAKRKYRGLFYERDIPLRKSAAARKQLHCQVYGI